MKYLLVLLLAFLVVSPTAQGIEGAATFTAIVTKTVKADGQTTSLKSLRDRHGRTVGWGNTVCFALGNSSSQCIGTFVLPKGKINVAGSRRSSTYFVLAIVGGTGVYSGAGGTLIGSTYRLAPPRERLVFFFS